MISFCISQVDTELKSATLPFCSMLNIVSSYLNCMFIFVKIVFIKMLLQIRIKIRASVFHTLSLFMMSAQCLQHKVNGLMLDKIPLQFLIYNRVTSAQ